MNTWDFTFWTDPITKKEHLVFGDQMRAITNPKWRSDIPVEIKCYHCDKYVKPDAAPMALAMALICKAQYNLEGGMIADPENIESALNAMLNETDIGEIARIARRLALAFDDRDFKRRRAAG